MEVTMDKRLGTFSYGICLFSLIKVYVFEGFKNPREDELYEFKEDGSICNLFVEFDRTNHKQDKMTDYCRVEVLYRSSQDYLLSSNAEYVICEESRKRGKSVIKEVGKIVI